RPAYCPIGSSDVLRETLATGLYATTVGTSRNGGPPMTTVEQHHGAATDTFESRDPATDDVVGTHPIHSSEDVAEVVTAARPAGDWWSTLSYRQRAERIQAWKGIITRRLPQLCELVHAETGKPHSDAQLEITLAIEHIDWAARNARKILGMQRRGAARLLASQADRVEQRRVAVVGVIGPWTYPVYPPLGSSTYSLAAGNAVGFKPSAYTPGVGKWLVDMFAEAAPEYRVLQLVTG